MPNITYNLGIPKSSNNPSVDQPKMLTNNDANDTIWDVDHFGFNDNNGGKHQFAHLVNVGSKPAVSSGESVIYTANVGPNSELFYRYGDPVSQFTFQLTNNGAVAAANNGYTSLVGPELHPMTMKWGVIAAPVSGDNPVVFSGSFVGNPFSIQLTTERAAANIDMVVIKTGSISSTGFTAIAPTAGSTNIFWLAIGQTA